MKPVSYRDYRWDREEQYERLVGAPAPTAQSGPPAPTGRQLYTAPARTPKPPRQRTDWGAVALWLVALTICAVTWGGALLLIFSEATR